jgi:hypothetical protein
MKNNSRITKNNLTHVLLLYYPKSYLFIKHFVFQNNGHWNVIK